MIPLRYLPKSEQRTPAEIAFLRFSDAALLGGVLEGRITAAITSLEALFLKGQERSELSHKLSLRAASLLRCIGLQPIKVQENLRKAYDIRSTHIHGGQVSPDLMVHAEELCREVLDYARISCATFLQLQSKVEKDEFLSQLDRALLLNESLEKVKQRLTALIIPTS